MYVSTTYTSCFSPLRGRLVEAFRELLGVPALLHLGARLLLHRAGWDAECEYTGRLQHRKEDLETWSVKVELLSVSGKMKRWAKITSGAQWSWA